MLSRVEGVEVLARVEGGEVLVRVEEAEGAASRVLRLSFSLFHIVMSILEPDIFCFCLCLGSFLATHQVLVRGGGLLCRGELRFVDRVFIVQGSFCFTKIYNFMILQIKTFILLKPLYKNVDKKMFTLSLTVYAMQL